jgi:hypothetical protein
LTTAAQSCTLHGLRYDDLVKSHSPSPLAMSGDIQTGVVEPAAMTLSAAISLDQFSTAFADPTPSGRLHDFASYFLNDNIGAPGRNSGRSDEDRLSGTPPEEAPGTGGRVSRTASENASPPLATCYEDAHQSHPGDGVTLAGHGTAGAVSSLSLHSATEGEGGDSAADDGGGPSASISPDLAVSGVPTSGLTGSGSSQPSASVAKSVAAAVAGWMSANAASAGKVGSRVPPVTIARVTPPPPFHQTLSSSPSSCDLSPHPKQRHHNS